jgi:hypothetical protein
VLPLFEGVRLFFVKEHIEGKNYTSEILKGKERLLRLTPDL